MVVGGQAKLLLISYRHHHRRRRHLRLQRRKPTVTSFFPACSIRSVSTVSSRAPRSCILRQLDGFCYLGWRNDRCCFFGAYFCVETSNGSGFRAIISSVPSLSFPLEEGGRCEQDCICRVRAMQHRRKRSKPVSSSELHRRML